MISSRSTSATVRPTKRAARRPRRFRGARGRRRAAAGARASPSGGGSRRRRSPRRRRAARRGAWRFPARARCPASGWRAGAARLGRERPRRHAVGVGVLARRNGSASSRMSCGRSRSGGQPQVDDVEAVEQVLAERALLRPPRPGCGWRSRGCGCRPCTGLPPPTRSISRSWMARSSLACRRTSISEISSSSSVPPMASSNLPMRRATAPVKAPFSWPNSSHSEQVLGDRGAVDARRTACRCGSTWRGRSARCTSLPVPLSPVIRIEASERRDLLGQLAPRAHRLVAEDEGAVVARRRPSTAAISSGSGGSGMYSLAPAWIAATAARASVPMPQATTGMRMRSASMAAISSATVEHHVDHDEVGALAGASPRGPVRCFSALVDGLRRGPSPSSWRRKAGP